MRNPDTVHWRDSARIPKFFFLDAYSALPLLFFLLHIRLWTFITCVSICVFFGLLNRFGFTLPVFLRIVRVFLSGNVRSARPWWTTKRNK